MPSSPLTISRGPIGVSYVGLPSSAAARLSNRASGQKGNPATMSPAFRIFRLTIASEFVMERNP
jgi:hypothetical protein